MNKNYLSRTQFFREPPDGPLAERVIGESADEGAVTVEMVKDEERISSLLEFTTPYTKSF